MNKLISYTTVFIAGFVLMAFEILGIRVLAPYFGSSVYVWGALISILLLALGIGYFAGGYIADKSLFKLKLPILLAIPALLMLIFPYYSPTCCKIISQPFFGQRVGVLLSSFFLFLPPALFLGTISPVLIKQILQNKISHVGRISGQLYALSTLGNIAGTLLTSFYLIGKLPTSQNIQILGLVLLILSIINMINFRTKTV